MKLLRSHGITRDPNHMENAFNETWYYEQIELGWNYRMTNIQAALGVAQLERLDEFISKKRNIGNLYNELFSSLKNVQKPLPKSKYAENIYWVYGVLINTFSRGLSIKNVINKLKAKGIDKIFCISVNDPHVMNAWGEANNVGNNITMLADPYLSFTKY